MHAGRSHGRSACTGRASLRFPEKTTLFDSDHPCHRVYLLRSGRVQLSTDHKAIVGYLGPGDFFGERLFCRRHIVAEAAESVTPITVEAYQRSELLDEFQDRRFAAKVLRNLAARIGRIEEVVLDFVTDRTKTRLAKVFARLIPRGANSEWVRLPVSPTNPEMARMIGSTRWRVSHLITQFQKAGWLRRDKGFSVRPEALRKFLQSSRNG